MRVKTVVLDGKSYTKASEVAAQFGYTADYIGQLCRSKKVDARLVGRTWFVHVPSVEAHRDQRYAYQKTQSQVTEKGAIYNDLRDTVSAGTSVDMTSKKYVKRVVPAPLSHRPFRPQSAPAETFFNPRPKYESDEYVLNPKIAKEPRITLLKVGIADAEQLIIQSTKRTETMLRPEPLPEVVLKGALSVQDIKNEDVTPTETLEPVISDSEIIRDNQENKAEVVLHPESEQTGRGLKVAISIPASAQSQPVANVLRASNAHTKRLVSQKTDTEANFTYQVAVRRVERNDEVAISSSDESILKEVPIVSPWQSVQVVSLYALGFIFALLSAGTVLMAESEAVATASETSRGVILQPASLMEIFDRLLR